MYFLIDTLNALDRVYHYSMANFVYILRKGEAAGVLCLSCSAVNRLTRAGQILHQIGDCVQQALTSAAQPLPVFRDQIAKRFASSLGPCSCPKCADFLLICRHGLDPW